MGFFILCLFLVLIGYKYFETFWSYKINKPYAWEQSVSLKTVPSELIKLERTFRDRVRFYNFWFQIEYIKKMEKPAWVFDTRNILNINNSIFKKINVWQLGNGTINQKKDFF